MDKHCCLLRRLVGWSSEKTQERPPLSVYILMYDGKIKIEVWEEMVVERTQDLVCIRARPRIPMPYYVFRYEVLNGHGQFLAFRLLFVKLSHCEIGWICVGKVGRERGGCSYRANLLYRTVGIEVCTRNDLSPHSD